MLTRRTIKFVHSLAQKKYRDDSLCFVAEGRKLVYDLLAAGMKAEGLYATDDFLASLPASLLPASTAVHPCTVAELAALSALASPPKGGGAICVFHQRPQVSATATEAIGNTLSIALDGVQDPGNLGTIIRTADWFGIHRIFASHETADVYSPKVVQSTMGALARVEVIYTDLPSFISSLPESTPVYGTFLDGDNCYTAPIERPEAGLLVMGNEGNGISAQVADGVTHRLYIPPFPDSSCGSESLNVASATAILCAELRRRIRAK